jgi:hypothetical protein
LNGAAEFDAIVHSAGTRQPPHAAVPFIADASSNGAGQIANRAGRASPENDA